MTDVKPNRRVITFGTFDVFHVGHLRMLQRAMSFGNWLAVGVSSDQLNLEKKGRLPVYPFMERMQIIAAIRGVDYVFAEESLEEKFEYISRCSADVFVIGEDWKGKFDHLNYFCEVVYLPRTEGVSTTAVIEKIRS